MPPALAFRAVPPRSKRSSSSQSRGHTVPHLPNEIWAEIHANIPPETVVKLIGVNHYFFDAAMNEIYKVVSVTNSDDVEQNKRLQELQNPKTASRVRHIQLSPYFLPFCDRDGKPLSQPTFFENPTFLKKMMNVLYNCKNLEHLTVQLHFTRAVTRPFQDFLKTLISRAGLRLRKLTIGLCAIHFRVLAAMSSSCLLSPGIDTVKLTLFPSNYINQAKQVRYRTPSNETLESFKKYMLDFSTSVEHSLQDLDITNHEGVDISFLFKSQERFSSLKKFQYRGYGQAHTLSDLQNFEQLLQTPTNLCFLSFRLLVPSFAVPVSPVDDLESTFHNIGVNVHMFVLELRALRDLRIQLPEFLLDLELDKLTSILVTFCPNLNRLVIEPSVSLTSVWFRRLLDTIAKFSRGQDSRGSGLKYLSFRRFKLFSAIHLDEILRNLPRLEVLAIEFERLSIDPEHRWRNPAESRAGFDERVLTTFRTRGYSSTQLKELYLRRQRGLPAGLLGSLAKALPNVHLRQGPLP